MKRPVCSISDYLRSHNFDPRARKIRAVPNIHQDIIRYDAPVRSRILPDHNKYGAFECHGMRMSPLRPQILPSLILFKEVTARKNSCSLDDFLVAQLPIK